MSGGHTTAAIEVDGRDNTDPEAAPGSSIDGVDVTQALSVKVERMAAI